MVLFTYVHPFGAILRRIEAFCEGVGPEGRTEVVVFLSAFILLVVARKRDENSQTQENVCCVGNGSACYEEYIGS